MVALPLVLAAIALVLAPAQAQEDAELSALLAECYGRGEGQDRNMMPLQLCSYTADIKTDDCDVEVEETIRLPHWPGGRFTMSIHKPSNQFYQDTVAFLLYKKGPTRADWDYYTYDLGTPTSTTNEYLITFEVAESKDRAVEFVYAYKVRSGIVRNANCNNQPNVKGSHVLEWRPVRWQVGAPKDSLMVVAQLAANATEAGSSPDASKLIGRDSISGVPKAQFQFNEISAGSLGATDAIVGFPGLEVCEATRECLKVRNDALVGEDGGLNAGHYIGIVIGAVLAIVFAYYLLKCMCMSAPGRRSGNNLGY